MAPFKKRGHIAVVTKLGTVVAIREWSGYSVLIFRSCDQGQGHFASLTTGNVLLIVNTHLLA